MEERLPVNAPKSTGNLDSFVQSSRQPHELLSTSQEIRDHGSTFVAQIYRITTPDDAKARVNHVKFVLHHHKPATHEVAAWRCMVLKTGHTGLGGPDDFELRVGSMDDGEKWAGGRVLEVMRNLAIIDAVVIVSRWYGGNMLGPARFTHIETCASEVCRAFKRSEGLREYVALLATLDDMLYDLRSELAQAQGNTSTSDVTTKRAKKDYSDLDITKAKRLVKAREQAIKGVKTLLAGTERGNK